MSDTVNLSDHDRQMLEVAEKAASAPDNTDKDQIPVPPMPEGGSDKYYDPKTGNYDWASHAKELAFKLAQKDKKGPEAKPSDEPAPTVDQAKEPLSEAEQTNIIESAGLKTEDLANQIREQGTISEDAMAALVAKGLPREIVEEYVELARFRLEQVQHEAMSYVGGESEWTKIAEWAGKNLPDDEKEMYNELLAGPKWRVAVDALRAKAYSGGAVAPEPSLVSNSGPSGMGGTGGYRSRAEMMRDMSTPEYKNDPAFRARVYQKMAVSRFEYDDGNF